MVSNWGICIKSNTLTLLKNPSSTKHLHCFTTVWGLFLLLGVICFFFFEAYFASILFNLNGYFVHKHLLGHPIKHNILMSLAKIS